jgi:hypothetical protein
MRSLRTLTLFVAVVAIGLGIHGAMRRRWERLALERLDERIKEIDRQLAANPPICTLSGGPIEYFEYGGLEVEP